MDLIDREAMMNYIRSNKINIGQVAHIVIMKQEPVNAVSEEVYTMEYNLRKDAEFKAYKLERTIDAIRAEIERKANSGQWSEATLYGMKESIEIIDKYRGKEDANSY